MNLPLQVFLTSVVIMFLVFSVYASIIWMQNTPKLIEIMRNKNSSHWSYRATIYYGIAFAIFVVSSVFISFVVFLAMKIWSM